MTADLVVGPVDLEHFSLHEGSTRYRGRTTIHMRVHDIKDDLIVFDDRMEDFMIPSQTVLYAPADQFEQQFRGLVSTHSGQPSFAMLSCL